MQSFTLRKKDKLHKKIPFLTSSWTARLTFRTKIYARFFQDSWKTFWSKTRFSRVSQTEIASLPFCKSCNLMWNVIESHRQRKFNKTFHHRSQDMTARTGQPGQDSQDKTAGGTGQVGQNSQDRAAGTGHLWRESQTRAVGTGQPGQYSQERTAKTSRRNNTARTGERERNKT